MGPGAPPWELLSDRAGSPLLGLGLPLPAPSPYLAGLGSIIPGLCTEGLGSGLTGAWEQGGGRQEQESGEGAGEGGGRQAERDRRRKCVGRGGQAHPSHYGNEGQHDATVMGRMI